MISTILFDFDGTLADTLPVCFYSFQKVFNKYDNLVVNNEEIFNMFGPSEVGILEQNIKAKDQMTQAIEDYYHFYDQVHDELVHKNHEIEHLLRNLKNEGISVGIVTGKGRRSFEISSKHLGLEELYEVSITGDDVVHPKPHPEGIITAMKLLNSLKNETVFVGDSHADIEAGKRANLKTVGVNWFNNPKAISFDNQPDYQFTKIDEFIKELLIS